MTDERRQREAAEDAALYEFLTKESEFYRGRTRELEAEIKALRAEVERERAVVAEQQMLLDEHRMDNQRAYEEGEHRREENE